MLKFELSIKQIINPNLKMFEHSNINDMNYTTKIYHFYFY